MPRTIHYIINARLPHKKAYGIQALQTYQSFVERGYRVILVCPSTRDRTSLREFYKLRTDVEEIRIPTPEWQGSGRLLYFAAAAWFMLASFAYLLVQRMRGKLDIIYTNDMDTFSFALLPFVGAPCFAEIHGPKPANILTRAFFRRVRAVITVNPGVRDDLVRTFRIPAERFLIEPCGVDDTWLRIDPDRSAARAKLGLPLDARIIAYVGRFYDWKGLNVIPHAIEQVPDVLGYLVGGSADEFKRVTNIDTLPENLRFPGEVASYEVPSWLAAADALIVPWPKDQKAFYSNMSPMKIYEYMALRRPVIGANDPTITEGITEGSMLLYEPGNAVDLASKIRIAIDGGPAIEQQITEGYETAAHHTLSKRAVRISDLWK